MDVAFNRTANAACYGLFKPAGTWLARRNLANLYLYSWCSLYGGCRWFLPAQLPQPRSASGRRTIRRTLYFAVRPSNCVDKRQTAVIARLLCFGQPDVVPFKRNVYIRAFRR
jgi:hypothetical protein